MSRIHTIQQYESNKPIELHIYWDGEDGQWEILPGRGGGQRGKTIAMPSDLWNRTPDDPQYELALHVIKDIEENFFLVSGDDQWNQSAILLRTGQTLHRKDGSEIDIAGINDKYRHPFSHEFSSRMCPFEMTIERIAEIINDGRKYRKKKTLKEKAEGWAQAHYLIKQNIRADNEG